MKSLPFVIAAALLPSTGWAQSPEQSAAYAHFNSAFAEICYLEDKSAAAEYYPPQSWELEWQEDYSDTPYSATLYQFFCSAGAYNVQLVYYLEGDFTGTTPIAFASPSFDVKYENDDFEGAVESIRLRGFATQLMLTNAQFDPETRTISETANWRGLGDASARGVWAFESGQFVLKSYDVDASYDGEINPERIVEYK